MEIRNIFSIKRLSKTTLATLVIVNVAVMAGVAPVHATGFQLRRTILNPTPAADDFFGFTVAGFDGKIIIGAPNDNASGVNGGAAYLFDNSTGALLHSFISPMPRAGDNFGVSVAALGGNVLIGDPNIDAGDLHSGTAYLFDGATGKLIRTFVNPAPSPNSAFGSSVAAMGNNALIGGFKAAYLFDGSTGTLLLTFHDPNHFHPEKGVAVVDAFGSRVLPIGNNVLIGAPLADIGATGAGAAYLFDGGNAKLLQTFLNPTPTRDGSFGLGLSSFEGNIIVGAPQDITGGMATGVVFIFSAATGGLVKTIPDPNPNPSSFNFFGGSIVALGNDIIVGAPLDSFAAPNSGTVYVFDGSTFSIVQTIFEPSPASSDQFGQSLATTGATVIVGAPKESIGGVSSGAAFLYA